MAGSLLLLGKVPVHTCQLPTRSFRSYAPTLESVSCPRPHFRQIINNKLLFKYVVFSGQSVRCNRLKPVSASSSENVDPMGKETVELKRGKDFEEWDSLTAKFAGAANIPFLLLQLPQIILNTRNLLAGNTAALSAVPWLGMFTGLLGNLSLLSYFIKKKEIEAMVVQALGVISLYVVILQLTIAEAMPLPHFIGTSIVVAFGLIVNFMKYFNFLNPTLWGLWEEFITIAGLSALPQVMWSTFIPYVPNTVLPGAIAFISAVITVVMARLGKLSEKGVKFLGYVSAWTATLLFMWMPVAQMWTNILNPENIKGLSAVSMLLAMIGNGFMIPRALIIRDLMWFTGAAWACVFYGWGNLICLYCLDSISKEFFLTSTFGFLAWIGASLLGYSFTSFEFKGDILSG